MRNPAIEKAQQALVSVSRQAAAEGIVLLKNDDQALPIEPSQVLSLFGRCQMDTYRSGTGSGGAVNVPYAVTALQGLQANPTIQLNTSLVALYQDWLAHHPFDDGGGGWAAEPWFQHEMPLTDEVVAQAASQSDKALVFIGRTAGEDKDYADEAGSYRLTELETDMLTKVCRHFSCVIVVMNVTNIIDMSWLTRLENHQAIKAVLYSWAAGMEGGHALADVLSGAVSPSGRLTDTIAHRLQDYPSSAHFGRKDFNLYAEDIYVGYRYFETFAPEAVQFEFGAGLSYSQFERRLVQCSSDVVDAGGDLTNAKSLYFEIEVRNIGQQFSSKEVVQLYVEAPQGQLGKPARALCGFAKTSELAPNGSEVVRISVPVALLASFDDSGASGYPNSYVLEAGQYHFYLGGSVRQAQKIDTTWWVEHTTSLETLSEACAPTREFERLVPAERHANGVYQPCYLPVPQRTVDLAQRIEANLPPTYAFTGDQGIKLADVAQGRASLEAFVAQLTAEQLAILVRGEGMCSPKVTPGTAAAFGGVCTSLFEFGIPVAAAADGPSGIRMDSGHQATQVPIGTLLACTWNTELNQQLYYLVGKELQAYQIDTLLGPGINIHRHPLNGRNFEYFSEDPLLTGWIAAAQTTGLKQAGVSGTIKHFAANDQETARVDVDSVMSQRALREIHIKPFEMAVKYGQASTVMTSYNPVNGHWAASNYDLNTTILRGEWGYAGIVMTDWWAKMNHPVDEGEESKRFTGYMLRAQNDLYMVVENDAAERNPMEDDTLHALAHGELTLGELQRSAMNICRFILQAPVMQRPLQAYQAVKPFAPLMGTLPDAAPLLPVTQRMVVNSQNHCELWVEVAQAGHYLCFAEMAYDREPLAQSSCSVSINGEFAMSLPTNGTEGKTVEIEGIAIHLQAGIYRIDPQFVKKGAELKTLRFEWQA
ncbi:glycoside hydrolase family 3 protein [Vibrio vulnificus]|uniref:glycoside hydrolase family 3 protein n=1 Tax=Vibrio vulnificus TaxID=672 RepID=UPI00188AFD30|nr:glycoside hydrolase family 3 protein [Vibrio vulnificus]MBF4452168.1 glycoside hydrolase family 3 C-terminal domain-containing protein [Vibrio vulnificus]MBF4497898.1 glycoside hydrolase family 3 C-terminal domain-containing protein [Vibrio vulnificus]MBL6180954.1 glycoside hydrolase family 3 C-terminal domain-containing protein [Vibrio vulnificus]HDY7982406.1 glycoside hydrolase family 3 C-terminal domain-containing protein [Vibrio vulnificus]HDY8005965.1 glycoside hydrolase family 3 C-ter